VLTQLTRFRHFSLNLASNVDRKFDTSLLLIQLCMLRYERSSALSHGRADETRAEFGQLVVPALWFSHPPIRLKKRRRRRRGKVFTQLGA